MRPKLLIPFLLAALLIISCNLPTASTGVFSPAATVTPTTKPCAWNWAYGDSSALTKQLQLALDKAQIVGTIKTESYGETGGSDCSYHEMDVTPEIIVSVKDTNDLPALASLATRIEEILQSAESQYGHKATLTNPRSVLIFKSSTAKECRWQFESKSCQ